MTGSFHAYIYIFLKLLCPGYRPGHCAVPQYARVCHKAAVSKVIAAPPPPPAGNHPASDAVGSACLSTTPPYENLAFHKVTINVPDKSGGGGVGEADRQRHVQRNPPLRKSKVPLKYQGIKRVKSRGREETTADQLHAEKSGYSQKERPDISLSRPTKKIIIMV